MHGTHDGKTDKRTNECGKSKQQRHECGNECGNECGTQNVTQNDKKNKNTIGCDNQTRKTATLCELHVCMRATVRGSLESLPKRKKPQNLTHTLWTHA